MSTASRRSYSEPCVRGAVVDMDMADRPEDYCPFVRYSSLFSIVLDAIDRAESHANYGVIVLM